MRRQGRAPRRIKEDAVSAWREPPAERAKSPRSGTIRIKTSFYYKTGRNHAQKSRPCDARGPILPLHAFSNRIFWAPSQSVILPSLARFSRPEVIVMK